MSKAIDVLRDEKVQRLLRIIRDKRIELIEPKVEFNFAVKYPVLDDANIPPEEVIKSLSALTEAGILISDVVDNVVVCPHCFSHRLMINVRCPSCHSSRLVMGRMIEHMTCGHIDFEERFKSEEGLFCPNCKKPLNQLGVDYKVFSSLYRCLSCKSTFSDPDIKYICDNGHYFEEEELTIYNVMAFKVNPEKRSLIESITFDVEAMLKPLKDEGLIVTAPIIIQGKSGIKHEFSFAIQQGNDPSTIIVGSVHTSDKAASVTDVLALWAKARDVDASHVMMITLSGIDEAGKKLAEAYAMKIIDGRDAHKATIEIKDHVTKILKEPHEQHSQR
ncbi:MAG: hypothetical protein QXD66_05450 [Candidatus Nezhaarchaeales archaeon]